MQNADAGDFQSAVNGRNVRKMLNDHDEQHGHGPNNNGE